MRSGFVFRTRWRGDIELEEIDCGGERETVWRSLYRGCLLRSSGRNSSEFEFLFCCFIGDLGIAEKTGEAGRGGVGIGRWLSIKAA